MWDSSLLLQHRVAISRMNHCFIAPGGRVQRRPSWENSTRLWRSNRTWWLTLPLPPLSGRVVYSQFNARLFSWCTAGPVVSRVGAVVDMYLRTSHGGCARFGQVVCKCARPLPMTIHSYKAPWLHFIVVSATVVHFVVGTEISTSEGLSSPLSNEPTRPSAMVKPPELILYN